MNVSNDESVFIGADFLGAMVATAPGEKFLTGRRPLRNWTRRTLSSSFLCRKLRLFLGKSAKTAATIRLSAGASPPDPTGEVTALPRTP